MGGLDPCLLVAEIPEPQAVGKPARGVDGEHQRAAPFHRRAQRERRGGGGLSHATGSDAADDLASFDRLHSASPMERATFSIACAPKLRSKRNGTFTSSRGTVSRRKASY